MNPASRRKTVKSIYGSLEVTALNQIFPASVFTADLMTASKDELTTHGNLHGLAGMIGIPGMTIAAVLLSRGLIRNPLWSPARKLILWSANLIWISLVLMVLIIAVTLPQDGGKFGPDVFIGWPNRIMMIAYAAWLMSVARQAVRLRKKRFCYGDLRSNNPF